DERGLRNIRHHLTHDLIRSALVASQHQETRRQGAKRAGVHAPRANQGEGCHAVGMSGRKPSPVSNSTGRKVSLLDAQVLEKLQETFLDWKFYVCHRLIPSVLQHSRAC